MKTRKSNLETIEPETEKPELQEPTDMQEPTGKRPQKQEIRLGREAQARIGELLRSMYNTYVHQGVPQHLDDLVRRLGDHD
jgi:hypothetical protein